MVDNYEGPVRILGGDDGIFLTTGIAALETDAEMGNWKGVLQTLDGTAVSGKALVVDIEIPDGARGKAQLTPAGTVGEKATSLVVGLGDRPF